MSYDPKVQHVPGGGSGSKFLRDDGTWETPSGGPGGSGAPTDVSYVALASNATLTNERVLTAGSGISFTDAGAGNALTITNTGAAASHTHAASDLASGTIATDRLGSGTANGTTFLRGDQTWATPSGGGAPTDASYVVMGLNGTLSAERVLSVGTGLALSDGGAGGNATLSNTLRGWSSICSTTADYGYAVNTLSNVTGLHLDVSANSSYRFEFFVLFSSGTATTNGVRLAVTCPSSPVRIAYTADIPAAADGTAGMFQGWGTSSGDAVIGTGVQAAATVYMAHVHGLLINGSSAGSLILQAGSELNASNSTVHANSYGWLEVLR